MQLGGENWMKMESCNKDVLWSALNVADRDQEMIYCNNDDDDDYNNSTSSSSIVVVVV